MNIVFMGTADFAVPALEALLNSPWPVRAVVTQPDRPRGRGQQIGFSPVKSLALSAGIEVYQPPSWRSPEALEWLRSLHPEVVVVAAYGQILPPEVLEVPSLGCINVHASLLPCCRGAAPIHWSVIRGEEQTGVTIMFMDRGMDTGDILSQRATAIGKEETSGQLHDRLAVLGAELLRETLELVAEGKAPRHPQDHSRATYAPPLKKEDELVHWEDRAENIRNLIRGLNPWPGAYTRWQDKNLKIWQSQVLEELARGAPGEILDIRPDQGLVVATGDQSLLITELQPEGKRKMAAPEFIRGYPVAPGQVLG